MTTLAGTVSAQRAGRGERAAPTRPRLNLPRTALGALRLADEVPKGLLADQAAAANWYDRNGPIPDESSDGRSADAESPTGV